MFYDTLGTSGVIDFLGEPDPAAASPETIAESKLVSLAVDTVAVRQAICEALNLRAPAWMLVGVQRVRTFPNDALGKPGDFDVIVGELHEGKPCFERICLIEIKRSPVGSNGRPKNRPSGSGTTQARGGAKLGFDRVLLVHMVLGPDNSIQTPLGKACLPENPTIVESTFKHVRRSDKSPSRRQYGLLIVEWARGRGAHLSRTGSVASTLAMLSPAIQVDEAHRRALEDHLRSLLPDSNCPETLFVCSRCGHVGCGGC
jgi:hypothetical protein